MMRIVITTLPDYYPALTSYDPPAADWDSDQTWILHLSKHHKKWKPSRDGFLNLQSRF